MNIKIKRAYEDPEEEDGKRILVDRLWPRGLTKEKAKIDYWPKELAPSTELRRWYGHDPEKWQVFRERYFAELDAQPVLMKDLLERLRRGTATFVYSSRERRLNNAVAIRDYIDSITR
jgi:uncharacterized protein YeaO (DUF488 family)